MNICIVVDNVNPKIGWGRLAAKVAERFRAHKHNVGFIVERGAVEPGTRTLVVPLRLASFKNFLWLPLTLWRIRRFMKPYDIVLCYDVNPNAIIMNLANLWQKRKIVIHALATYSLLGRGVPVRNFLMRWAYRRAIKTLVVSEFTRWQIEQSGVRLHGCAIVPVGVDTEVFTGGIATERPVLFPYILSVGALKNRKGFHISIPAFSLIARDFPNLKYLIIGNQELSSYVRKIRSLIKELGLEDRVILIEKVSDAELVRYYRSAALFVLTPVTTPDAFEGFGMVYLEAGACGKPVIGTYHSGAEAAIIDEYNGLLAQPEPKEISMAMKKILRDEYLSKTLGDHGIQRAAEFTWANVAHLYLKNFNDALQKN